MKKRIVFLVFFVISIAAWAQNTEVYRVISISGSIEHVKQNRPLQQGDRISLTDPLKFSNKSDFVIVIHPKIGRKMIKGVPDNSPRELENLIQSFVKPTERSTASRSTSNEYWAALNETLKDTVVILGDGIINLNSEFVKLKPPAVVVAIYKVKKDNSISRKISSGQDIMLGKGKLFPEIGDEVKSKIMIEYYSDEKLSLDLPGSGELIGNFWPRYLDEDKLERECRVILDVYADQPSTQSAKEIKNFIVEHYGRVEDNNFSQWLKQRHLIP
jgi:hypothetical protein